MYTHIGDIKIGECTNDQILLLLDYVKQKSQDGDTIYLKKVDGIYYLSIQVCIGALLDHEDPLIYIHPSLSLYHCYFDDLYIPFDKIQCITYSNEKNNFISTIDTEGCVIGDFECDTLSLYEIIPIKEFEYIRSLPDTQTRFSIIKNFFKF